MIEVKIGNQIWMKGNLNVGHFRNGDSIQEVKGAPEWEDAVKNAQPAWCYFDNDTENGKKYGKLYNWCAVNDPRGLAPEGWHIPSDEEWSTLIDLCGRTSVAGDKLKGVEHWLVKRQGITNELDFSVFPAGRREGNGQFDKSTIGFTCFFWGTNDKWTNSACVLSINSFLSSCLLLSGNYEPALVKQGLSVRCIKD